MDETNKDHSLTNQPLLQGNENPEEVRPLPSIMITTKNKNKSGKSTISISTNQGI